MNYKYLGAPINIGKLQLKNRTVMLPITLQYGEGGPDGGYVNDTLKNFYFRRAEGGAAMIIAGGVATDNYCGYDNMIRLGDDKYIPGMKELADGIHERGSRLCLQFLQTGRYGKKAAVYGDTDTLSASAIPSGFSGETPRAMTIEEIKMVIGNAAKAAVRAKTAGVDVIEICANSGYMISQFLSEVTNKRTDEYGGSLDNRLRFGCEMIAALREAVGPDYPLILRVAGNQFMKDGYETDETIEFCKRAEKLGVNCIDVTGGWHETNIPQLPGDVPRGGFTYLAEAIKKNVSIPVISSNRHNDPNECETVIATGQADIVGLCRTLVADPDWPNKALFGNPSEIRKCLACNQGCFANVFAYKPCKCLFNSYVGREEVEKAIKPADDPKKLLVVGAGPAGCEFAYRAASRGHKVTIWEKGSEIGGTANIAAIPPAKGEFYNIKEFYEAILKKYGVEVVFNKKATADDIKAAGFDEVITATGCTAKSIPVEVPDGVDIIYAQEILKKEKFAGKNVLVIGGGSVGCETADYLAQEASLGKDKLFFLLSQQAAKPEEIMKMMTTSSRNITVFDIAKIGANYDYGCGWPIMKDLHRLGVKMYGKSKLHGIDKDGAHIETLNRKTKETYMVTAPVDTVVLAVGYTPDDSLADELKAAGITVHNIGDSKEVRKVMDAILEADDLAAEI